MAIEAEEMKAKKRPIIGGILVFVGLLEIGFGGRAVSIIGTKDYFSADAWSSGVLIFGMLISALGVWISGAKIKRLGKKSAIKVSKKGVRFSN
jgi:hypothetical protein